MDEVAEQQALDAIYDVAHKRYWTYRYQRARALDRPDYDALLSYWKIHNEKRQDIKLNSETALSHSGWRAMYNLVCEGLDMLAYLRDVWPDIDSDYLQSVEQSYIQARNRICAQSRFSLVDLRIGY